MLFWLLSTNIKTLFRVYSVSTSMYLLQVHKCDNKPDFENRFSIYINLQVYTETCLTVHLYYSGLRLTGQDTLDKFIL